MGYVCVGRESIERADQCREYIMQAALDLCAGKISEHEKLIAQLESQLDRCCKKLWVEWVPVAEQLPTRDQVVLVAWEGWELVTLGHFIDGDWFDPVVAFSEYGPPTHWMPLPIGPRHFRPRQQTASSHRTRRIRSGEL